MALRAGISWLRLLTGVLAAFLIREWLAPSAVQATCGDYVTIPSPRGASGPFLAPSASSNHDGQSSPVSPAPMAPSWPCTTAGCSPLPDDAAAGTVSVDSAPDLWALSARGFFVLFHPLDDFRRPSEALQLQEFNCSIFHPPR